MFIKPRQNMFERMRQLQEAEGDDAADIMNTGVDQTTTNTDANAQNTNDNPDAGEAESTGDDDLNVDVNLGDENADAGGEDTNNDFGGGTDDTSGGDSTTSTGSNDKPDEEVKKGNTDLFASLTAEEQSIKIMELKKLYNDLYVSIDDLIDKLNDIAMINIDPRVVVRITSQMEELRRILQDYIINTFPLKTYYENDVNYSIFLNMLTTLRGVFDDIYKENERNRDKK